MNVVYVESRMFQYVHSTSDAFTINRMLADVSFMIAHAVNEDSE